MRSLQECSFLTSGAKAESMSIECSGGIAERTERAIIVLVGTGLHGLGVSYALATSAWLLAILRIDHNSANDC